VCNAHKQQATPQFPVQEYYNNKAQTICIENGIHGFSNGFFDDDSWPKVKWLKEQLAKELASVQISSSSDEKECIQQLVDRLGNALSNTSPFPIETLPDPSFSPLSPDKEIANQRVFIPHNHRQAEPPLEQSGTRCQTILVRTKSRAYMFYRSTDDYPEKIGEWLVFEKSINS